jgi:hypothetical protein
MKWLVLTSHPVHEGVSEFLFAAGEDLLSRKESENTTRPDIVILDNGASKRAFLAAGFWRGMGVPVLYLGKIAQGERRAVASKYGFWCVRDLDHLKSMVAKNHPVLTHAASRTRGQVVDPKALQWADWSDAEL